jgi:serpin B
MMKRKLYLMGNGLLALVFVLAGLAGCSTAPAANVAMAKSAVARETAPETTAADRVALVDGNSAFAFDLYRALRTQDGNLFFSPYSVSAALAMTYAGVRGETARQMADILHFALSQEQLHPAFNALDQELVSAGEENAFQLHIANALWGQEEFPFRSTYLDTLARHYGAGMRLVDYIGAEERELARRAINDWVSQETGGQIEELIGEGVLNGMTRLVLTNAIYFKGLWEAPFPPHATQEAAFTLPDGSQVNVSTMARRADAPYTAGEDYQVVALPYQGGRAAMLILLPAEGRFEAFERTLDAGRLQGILQALETQDLKLYLPKFQFAAEIDLVETLRGLGMRDAFDREKADFSGMYDPDQVGGRRIFISDGIHKAFVNVDEEGTEAAAATGIVEEIVSEPVRLRVDRPFLFVIYDRQTGTLLFVGRVLDPR